MVMRVFLRKRQTSFTSDRKLIFMVFRMFFLSWSISISNSLAEAVGGHRIISLPSPGTEGALEKPSYASQSRKDGGRQGEV